MENAKVKIPQWLADKVEEVTKKSNGYKAFYELMERTLEYTEEYKYALEHYSLRDLVEIIEGNYEIEKEYIGIVDVFGLKKGSLVAFDNPDDSIEKHIVMVVEASGSSKWLTYKDDGDYVSLDSSFLRPYWFIVKEVK